MGVKLFAWLGGLALFLGVVFMVKYSFENNLITPLGRIAIGGAVGLVLIGAGWWLAEGRYRVTAQSLCATGIVILYADLFAAHSFYGLISLTTAFFAMSAVTLGSFLLAANLSAQVIVILGLLGGFLTPALLPSGSDNALVLFLYIALLDLGVAAVALRKALALSRPAGGDRDGFDSTGLGLPVLQCRPRAVEPSGSFSASKLSFWRFTSVEPFPSVAMRKLALRRAKRLQRAPSHRIFGPLRLRCSQEVRRLDFASGSWPLPRSRIERFFSLASFFSRMPEFSRFQCLVGRIARSHSAPAPWHSLWWLHGSGCLRNTRHS